MKVLFDQKEGRLRSERDAAQRQLQHLQAQQEDWDTQVRGGLAASAFNAWSGMFMLDKQLHRLLRQVYGRIERIVVAQG